MLVAATLDGIARTACAVTDEYVAGFMQKAATAGIELVWQEGGRILGEIHASCPGIAALSHLLTDLTIAVAPEAQGRGLFPALREEVICHMPHIQQVEPFARVANERARALSIARLRRRGAAAWARQQFARRGRGRYREGLVATIGLLPF